MKNTTLISLLILGIMLLQTFALWCVVTTRPMVTQPTEVKVLDLPEEFDLVTTDDTLMCYTRNDTLFVRFDTETKQLIGLRKLLSNE